LSWWWSHQLDIHHLNDEITPDIFTHDTININIMGAITERQYGDINLRKSPNPILPKQSSKSISQSNLTDSARLHPLHSFDLFLATHDRDSYSLPISISISICVWPWRLRYIETRRWLDLAPGRRRLEGNGGILTWGNPSPWTAVKEERWSDAARDRRRTGLNTRGSHSSRSPAGSGWTATQLPSLSIFSLPSYLSDFSHHDAGVYVRGSGRASRSVLAFGAAAVVAARLHRPGRGKCSMIRFRIFVSIWGNLGCSPSSNSAIPPVPITNKDYRVNICSRSSI
jgi:hypothetical protein